MSLVQDVENFRNYFHSKEKRRQTFTSWVFEDDVECNADALAEAGFIYVGTKDEPDSTQCFVCKKTLDGWEAEDNPWSEHLKHQKDCPFAALQKSQSKLTVQEYIEAETECLKKVINSAREQDLKDHQKWYKILVSQEKYAMQNMLTERSSKII
ncbi:unnamed protein product [Acanthoscelides obtectus]|uniref:Uncharacterized protein n=1 Tax=Acanthoscelides obtectus TaxID=200917 RepID=A0A9P0Q832_ACAOB|nr:unnamed protein product [Acanthoscelides obtectus]CAK1672531.1 Baculoviral IAP repeat-containing protein 5.1 [Acanthoscelides obtectus]